MSTQFKCKGFTSPRIRFLCMAAAYAPLLAQSANANETSLGIPNVLHAAKQARSLPIFYDSALVSKGFPSPLIRARIAGHEALFIVDSGASVNTLAEWYANLTKLPTNTVGSVAKDSGGNAGKVLEANRVQGIWSNHQRFTLNKAIVVAFPPLFESLNIGGLISPQRLAPIGMAAALDLRIPSLQFVPFAKARSNLKRSITSRAPMAIRQRCVNDSSSGVKGHYLAPVTAAGVTDLVLVDTGATKTVFSEESNIGHALGSGSEPGPQSEGAWGEITGRRMVRGVQLLRGGQLVTLNPSIGNVSVPCDAKGILGMDALRSCSVVLGDDQMVFSCS